MLIINFIAESLLQQQIKVTNEPLKKKYTVWDYKNDETGIEMC